MTGLKPEAFACSATHILLASGFSIGAAAQPVLKRIRFLGMFGELAAQDAVALAV